MKDKTSSGSGSCPFCGGALVLSGRPGACSRCGICRGCGVVVSPHVYGCPHFSGCEFALSVAVSFGRGESAAAGRRRDGGENKGVNKILVSLGRFFGRASACARLGLDGRPLRRSSKRPVKSLA